MKRYKQVLDMEKRIDGEYADHIIIALTSHNLGSVPQKKADYEALWNGMNSHLR